MKKLVSLIICSALGMSMTTAKPVTGVVTVSGKGLAGVVVSDGYGFAKSDAKGRFKLDLNKDAKTVFVVTPAGYVAPYQSGVPMFFAPVEAAKAKYNFDLMQYGNADSYSLLAIADPQVQNERHIGRFEKETLVDLKETAKELSETKSPAVGISLGDITWDVMANLTTMKGLLAQTQIPFYAVIGNHDHDRTKKGDDACVEEYQRVFGPAYYAFNLGHDHYVVLDNITYDSDKKYDESVDQRQLEWLKGYLDYVPKGEQVIVCMHSPMMKFFQKNLIMKNGDKLLALLDGYRVRFMTGHTHINSNFEVAEGVLEHNVASAGGSWWTANVSKDGTPCGYQIFTANGDDFTWQYKSTGKPLDFQFKAYDRGTFAQKANSVVAKVWNWDNEWKVEWSQDGKPMGAMERFEAKDPDYLRYLQKRRDQGKAEAQPYKSPVKSFFYFAATPDPYAKEVEVKVTDRAGRQHTEVVPLRSIDVQAHRGGIGLMPENTIEAMINAVKLGVNTLELDLNISSDGKVVVSHDPYMNYKFVTPPAGLQLTKENAKEYKIYNMTYDSIRKYEVGLKPHPDFPNQKKVECYKPLLSDLIDAVEKFTAENGYAPMKYNIEIKSSEKKDNVFTPPYKEYTDLVMEVFKQKNLGDRLIIQSFDPRGLNYLHQKYPDYVLSYLVDKSDSDFEANMKLLEFVPQWYSPHYTLVNAESLAKWHAAGMKVVPWTADKPEDIRRLADLGVDAIISNYPDRVLSITRTY